METNEAYDPADALRDVQLARERLADRAKALACYYPALGAAAGVLVAGVAAGPVLAGACAVMCVLICVLLITWYRKSTGLWVTYGGSGPRARLVWAAYGVVIAALLWLAVWVQLTGRPGWWGISLGITMFLITVVVGRFFEPRLREDILTGAVTPTSVQ